MPNAPKQPNILFIFTDQQRADTMAAYGNHWVQAPNFKRLTDSAFVFENGYVTSPICTPSRSSIMTGLYPHSTGCRANNEPLDASVPTIAQMLPNEYTKAYHGKWHLGDEVIRQQGFDHWVSIEDQYRRYYTHPSFLEVLSDYHHFLVEHGYEPDKESVGKRVFSRPYAAVVKEEHTKAQFLADRSAEFIRENRDRQWALYINIFEPHPPYDSPLNDLYDPEEMTFGPAFMQQPGEDASSLHRIAANQYEGRAGSYSETPWMPESEIDESIWRKIKARYYGSVTLVDRALGKVLDALEDAGVADRTMVVFTAEHGDQLGEHAVMQKSVFYEESAKVPFIIRVPWLSESEVRVPGRVSTIDLVPTLLDLANVRRPRHLQGKSLVPVMRGQHDLSRNNVILEWNSRDLALNGYPRLGTEQNIPRRMIVTPDGWKMFHGPGDNGEMYDLNADPHELTNLYADPSHASKRRELAEHILHWQTRVADTATMPEA